MYLRLKEMIYRRKQKQKQERAEMIGLPLPGGMRALEKRKYLTRQGFKNWDELSLDDKLSLNVII